MTAQISTGGYLNGVLDGSATQAASAGVAVFSGMTVGGTVGSTYTITFSSGALTTTSATVSISAPGTASQLIIQQQPIGGSSGSRLGTQPIIQLKDAAGNVVTSDSSTVVTATIKTGSSGSLSASGSVTATASSGTATFTSLSLTLASGWTQLTFTAGALSVNSSTLTTSTSAALLVSNQSAVGGSSGALFATQPWIAIGDSSSRTVSSSSATVAVVASTGCTLSGTTSVNAVNGIAKFTDLKCTGTAGTQYTLTFSSSGLTSVSQLITLPTAAAKVVVTTTPVASSSGSTFSTKAVVSVQDASNRLVTGNTDSITVAITAGSGGNLTTGTSVNAVDGVATFTSLVLTGKVGTGYTLTFSSGILTTATAPVSPSSYGAPNKLFVNTALVTAASGETLSTQPVIEIRDVADNLVENSSLSVSVAITAGSGGSIGGTAAVSATGGIATFAALTFAGITTETYSVTYSATGVTSAISTGITVTAGAAHHLAVLTQPSGAVNRATFTAQPEIVVVDAEGNTVDSSAEIVAAINPSSSGATLSGSATVSATSGVVTFTDLALTGTVGNYRLDFSSTGLTGVTSSTFTLSASSATTIAVTNGSGASSRVALTTQPIITFKDADLNTASNTSVVTASIGAGATITAGATATAVAGVATFSGLTIQGTAGTYTITYTVTTGSTSLTAVTQSITLAAGAVSTIVVTTTGSGANSGAALTTQPAITFRDADGNTVSNTSTVTASIAGGAGASVTAGATKVAVAGVATFSGLTIAGTAGSYTITFTVTTGSTSLSAVTQSITLAAGAGSTMSLTTSAAGAVASSAFTTQPVIQLKDASGNNISTSGVTVTATLSSGTFNGGSSTATATSSSGVATFGGLRINVSGSYTITYSVSGYASGATQSLTVSNASTTISISLPGGATTATYGTAVVITATVGQEGTVNFKIGASSISGCNAVSTSSLAATCTWTPSTVTTSSLTAVLIPTDSSYDSPTSSAVSVVVGKATLTVTPAAKTVTYSSAAPTYTSTVTGFKFSDTAANAASYIAPTCTSSYSNSTSVAASPKTISCSGGSAINYLFDNTATANLTITKATPVITWSGFLMRAGNLTSGQLNASSTVAGPITFAFDNGNPVSVGTSVSNSCNITATLVPTNTTDYNTATRTVAVSVSAGAPAVPAKPTIASDGSETQIILTWTISSNDGGSAVTDYEYRYALQRDGDEPSWGDWKSSGKIDSDVVGGFLTKTVTGLTKDKSYVFQVRAKNSAGTSSASTTSEAASTAGSAAPLPGAPTLATPTYNGTLVSVGFTAGTGTPTSYQYSVNDGTSWSTLAGLSSPFTISGLTRGTTYKIRLRGVNATGNGTSSDSKTYVPIWKPSTPVLGSLTVGSGTITVPFTPSVDNGGATVTYKYHKAVSTDGGATYGSYGSDVTVVGSSPVVISGITNDSYYKIEFWAETSAGESPTRTNATINANRASTPTISTQPVGSALTAGQAASYTLSVTATKGRSADTIAYQWYHDGTAISLATNSTYVISGVIAGDAGLYKVEVKESNNGNDQIVTSTEVTITVNASPTISTGGTLAAATAGGVYSSITLATSNGTTPFSNWAAVGTLPSGLTLSSSGVISGTVSGSATVGTYTFTVTARDARSVTTPAKTFTIVVSKSLTITTTSLGNASKLMSPQYSASLNASGGATPYVWSISESDENRLPAGLSLADDGSITGTPTSEAKSQSFTVRVTDANGAYTTTKFTINIVTSVPGKPTITAQSAGNKSITLSWSEPTPSSTITSYVINFIKPKGEHNDEGGDDDEEKGSVITPTNARTYTVSGLKNGVKYTVTVSARTAGGSGAPSDPVSLTTGSLPGAPRSAVIVKSSSGFSLRWSAPEYNGGRSITSWDVGCVKSSDNTPAISATSLHSTGEGHEINKSEDSYSYKIASEDLEVGTSYKCRVLAETPAGKSEWSDYSSPAVYSSAPKKPTVTSVDATTTPGTAVVSWTALSDADNGGSEITGYVARLKKNSEGEGEHESERYCSTSGKIITTCSIKGVPTKGSFTVTLVAKNAIGNSEARTFDVNIAGREQHITLPSVATKTVGDADFTFEATTDSGLRLRYSIDETTATNCSRTEKGLIRIKNAGDCTIFVNQDGRQHDHEDDGDGEGDSDWAPVLNNSVSLTFTILPKTPNAPTITSVTPGNQTIVITWRAPTGNGGAPTKYEFAYKKDVDASWTSATAFVVNGATLTKTLTGLTNGLAYNVRIRSFNEAVIGTSSWVTATGSYIPFTVPNAPVITTSGGKPTSSAANSSVTIEWTLLSNVLADGENGGKTITGYTVTPYIGSDPVAAKKCTTNASTSQCTITGLTNKTSYKFRVVATNSAGSSADSNEATVLLAGVDQTIDRGTIPTLYGWTVGDPDKQLNPTASSGLPIAYSVAPSSAGRCTVTQTGAVHFVSDGLCEINLEQDGTDNGAATKYNEAPPVSAIQMDIQPATPSAPSITSVTNGLTGLTILWSAPSRLGGGTISYLVSAKLGGTTVQTCTSNEPTRTCELIGAGHLVKGTTYSITVVAHSDAGDGPGSSARNGTWMTKPDAPATLVVSATTDASEADRKGLRAVITKSPSDGGSAITIYTVTATNSGTSLTCTVASSGAATETCDIHGATPGLTYTTQVYATNSINDSDATSGNSIVPGVTQTFDPDSDRTISYPITHADFNAGFTTTSGLAVTYDAPSNDKCTINSSGLIHLVKIGTCVITARQSGVGSIYQAAQARTLTITITKTKPAQAIINTVTISSATALNVSWTMPTFIGGTGAVITGKKVVATGTGGSFECTPVTLAENTCQLSGLTTAATYAIVVMLDNYDADTGASAYNEFASTSAEASGTPVGTNIDAPEPAYAVGGTRRITLHWSTPQANNTGQAITGYEVQRFNGATWETVVPTDLLDAEPNHSGVVGTLGNALTYSFRIRATTADPAVNGQYSYQISAKTNSKPTAPTSVTVTPGTTSAIVSWRAPDSNGGASVSKFKAYSGSTFCEVADENATTCLIEGLTPGEIYTFKVFATNEVDDGTEAVISDVRMLAVPDAPVLVSTTPENSSGTVLVTFNKSVHDGGKDITRYTVKAYTSYTSPLSNTYAGFSCAVTTNLSNATNSCRVSGLSYKTDYKFAVFATSEAGNSADSNVLTPVRLEIAQTITFTVTSLVGYSTATQTLNASTADALPITYTVALESAAICEEALGIITFKTIGTCTITATQDGDSRHLPADPVTREIVIAASAPDAPTLTQVTPSAYSLDATWSAPLQRGGSTISYYILSWAKNSDFSDENSATTSSTNLLITGLDAGSSYRVRVRAITTDYADGSIWSNILTGTPFGAPLAPTDVRVTGSTGTGLATVAYSPPNSHTDWTNAADNGGLTISGFLVEAFVSTDLTTAVATCTAGSTDTSCVISGLKGSVSYKFKATSFNAVGSAVSEPSDSYSAGVAQTITVNNQVFDHGSIPFLVTDYASVNSGLPLTFSMVENFADTWSTTHHVCTFDPVTGIVTMDAAGTCSFTVSQNGKDAFGNETAYLPLTGPDLLVITVSALIPDVVPTTTVMSPNSQELTVNWTEPLDEGGAPVISYKIVWYKKDGGTVPVDTGVTNYSLIANPDISGTLHVGSAARSQLLSGLINGTTYYIFVYAENRKGYSL